MRVYLLLLAIISISFAQDIQTAVVIVDMQESFYDKHSASNTQKVERLVKEQIKLLESARKYNLPVVIFEYFNWGSTDSRILEAAKGLDVKIVTKYRDGGFDDWYAEEAQEFLQSRNVENLIISGLNGDYCIKDTVLGAHDFEYNIIVNPKQIGNIDSEEHIVNYPYKGWELNNASAYRWENALENKTCSFEAILNTDSMLDVMRLEITAQDQLNSNVTDDTRSLAVDLQQDSSVTMNRVIQN
jgi:nicotinamidase-related amidase